MREIHLPALMYIPFTTFVNFEEGESLFVNKVFGVNVGVLKFATNQYFELHREENNNYVVKYIFNDDEKFSIPYRT